MKFKLLFIFIIIYILGTFGWLTYSLVNFSNKEYGLQKQVLEAGRQACVLRLIEKSKNYDFSSESEIHIIFKQAKIDADTNLLNAFLETYNYGRYTAAYTKVYQGWDLDIQIAPHQIDRLEQKLQNRERLYIFQALTAVCSGSCWCLRRVLLHSNDLSFEQTTKQLFVIGDT